MDNFGVPLGDFQSVAMQWADLTRQESIADDVQQIHFWSDYQQQKHAEYAEKFASEQGGNIGDDVDF